MRILLLRLLRLRPICAPYLLFVFVSFVFRLVLFLRIRRVIICLNHFLDAKNIVDYILNIITALSLILFFNHYL